MKKLSSDSYIYLRQFVSTDMIVSRYVFLCPVSLTHIHECHELQHLVRQLSYLLPVSQPHPLGGDDVEAIPRMRGHEGVMVSRRSTTESRGIKHRRKTAAPPFVGRISSLLIGDFFSSTPKIRLDTVWCFSLQFTTINSPPMMDRRSTEDHALWHHNDRNEDPTTFMG